MFACKLCGKQHVVLGRVSIGRESDVWECQRCGHVNVGEVLDTREAFRAESPFFGALLCPDIKREPNDGQHRP